MLQDITEKLKSEFNKKLDNLLKKIKRVDDKVDQTFTNSKVKIDEIYLLI